MPPKVPQHAPQGLPIPHFCYKNQWFFNSFQFLIFSLLVPLVALLGSFWASLERLGAQLGHLGRHLGLSLGLLGASWLRLGALLASL